MIEKPACFSYPCMAPASPCRRCGVLAACARRLTQVETFGLLMFPRIDPPQEAGGDPLPAPLLFDPAIEKQMSDALSSRASLTGYRGRVWKWRRERVAVIREASAVRVAVEFPLVAPGRVAMMRSARNGVQVAALLVGDSDIAVVTPGDMAKRKAQATGSVVWASTWEPVIAVAVDVAAVVFQGGGFSD